MRPFSGSGERVRPGQSRRSKEISMVTEKALLPLLDLDEYPNSVVDVFIELPQTEAGSRCAGICAASMALADAGVPMRNLISSCSVGVVDGEIALDIAGLEDNYGDVDMAVATIGNEDKFVLLQMDGIITRDQMKTMLDLAKKGCAEIYEKQKQALKDKYKTGEIDDDESE